MYDFDSPIDYCVIYFDKGDYGIDCAAIVVNELFNSLSYDSSKEDIEKLLKASEEKTSDESSIELTGNIYPDASLYCAYQPDLNIVIIAPPDLDINDITSWVDLE